MCVHTYICAFRCMLIFLHTCIPLSPSVDRVSWGLWGTRPTLQGSFNTSGLQPLNRKVRSVVPTTPPILDWVCHNAARNELDIFGSPNSHRNCSTMSPQCTQPYLPRRIPKALGPSVNPAWCRQIETNRFMINPILSILSRSAPRHIQGCSNSPAKPTE